MKFCCSCCFNDKGLSEQIIPTFSEKIGKCDYCGTDNDNLIKPSRLRDNFDLLINVYERDDDGKTLIEWFKEDWGMFSHRGMDHANACMLLADILDDGDIVRRNYSPSKLSQPDQLDLWDAFKKELMYENRFFPKLKMDEGQLSRLLNNLSIEPKELSNIWYRARVQRTKEQYLPAQMGAPPKELASQGRANPVGIPYLYIASTLNTAVSEIRPHTGELVSVAKVTIDYALKLIDLRNPRDTVSPFYFDEEKKIAQMRGDIEFLVQLGKELSRPVLPHAAAIDYLPTQYICEFIKNCTYDGVIYKSSVGEGINLALFDSTVAKIGNIESCNVSNVIVEVES